MKQLSPNETTVMIIVGRWNADPHTRRLPSGYDVTKASGLSPGKVYMALIELVIQGLIERVDRGVATTVSGPDAPRVGYRWTDKARQEFTRPSSELGYALIPLARTMSRVRFFRRRSLHSRIDDLSTSIAALSARLGIMHDNDILILQSIDTILEGQQVIMALVQIDQTVLDGFGEALGTIADSVQALVDDPANPVTLEDANVSAITAAISRLQGELAKPTEPVEEQPATDTPEGAGTSTDAPASDEDGTSV